MRKTLLIAAILGIFSIASAGCAKDRPYVDGVDWVNLKKGQSVTAPVDGKFISDRFFKYEVDKC